MALKRCGSLQRSASSTAALLRADAGAGAEWSSGSGCSGLVTTACWGETAFQAQLGGRVTTSLETPKFASGLNDAVACLRLTRLVLRMAWPCVCASLGHAGLFHEGRQNSANTKVMDLFQIFNAWPSVGSLRAEFRQLLRSSVDLPSLARLPVVWDPGC